MKDVEAVGRNLKQDYIICNIYIFKLIGIHFENIQKRYSFFSKLQHLNPRDPELVTESSKK